MPAARARNVALKCLAGAVALIILFYLGEDLCLRVPIPRSRNPYGTVQIKSMYAIPEKNQKTEFILADPQTATCVHSVLPHLGYSPCWYLERKKLQQINE